MQYTQILQDFFFIICVHLAMEWFILVQKPSGRAKSPANFILFTSKEISIKIRLSPTISAKKIFQRNIHLFPKHNSFLYKRLYKLNSIAILALRGSCLLFGSSLICDALILLPLICFIIHTLLAFLSSKYILSQWQTMLKMKIQKTTTKKCPLCFPLLFLLSTGPLFIFIFV